MKDRLRNNSFITMMLELLWFFIALSTFIYMYSILEVPDPDQVIDVKRYYDFLFFNNIPESTINLVLAYSTLIISITVPLLVFNFKFFKNLKEDNYQRESGYYRIVAGLLSIVALNIPAAIYYFISGKLILKEKPKVKIEYKHEEFGTKGEYYRRAIMSIIAFFFLVVLAIIIIIPFYWMIITALMSKSTFESFDTKFFLSFKEMNWINFKEALVKVNIGRHIKNTLIVAFFTTFGSLIVIILSAFAFSRLEFKGRDFLFSVLLMTMMVPGELYVITNFVTVTNTFNWYNKFQALIFPFIVDIFFIFFLRQTFKQIPDSMYKAAKVDGCSDFKYLLRVMIPIARPTLITITILNALSTWNAYVWPRLVTEEDHHLVSIGLRAFADAEGRTDYRLQMAAAALITVPIIIVFLFARKYIMRGVGRSGTKG